MGNILAELHLLLMVVSFVWHSVTTYAATDAGQAELKDIEDVYNGISTADGTVTPTEQTINDTLEAARAKYQRATK